ncbi:MAG: DUF1501 domain-containing protein [Anaerolineae bacterium]|nr:DUF1501 domain-containing protein [Anaerolineae bacterium]
MTTSRRSFLKSAGIVGAGLFLQDLYPSWMPRLAFAQNGASGDVIVCVFLRGGADALNIVVPFGDDDYYRARPTLSLAPPDSSNNSAVLELTDFFGLNPDMAAMHELLTSGQMTAIHAVGAPHVSRSHFEAMDLIERGTDGSQGANTGWLGRYLSQTASDTDTPLRAIGWSDSLQTSLLGYIPATALRSITDYHLASENAESFQASMSQMYQSDDALTQAAQSTIDTLNLVQQIDVDNYIAANNAQYYETNLGRALKQTAALIKADAGLEVACIDMGGFDTHIAQGNIVGTGIGEFPFLVKELADNLRAFHDDLLNHIHKVTVVVMSEFGRRVQENGATGTDHGHGGVMFVMSSDLQPVTVHGQWLGINSRFLDNGDLAITNDYRDVLSEIMLQRTTIGSVNNVFPNYRSTPIGLYR